MVKHYLPGFCLLLMLLPACHISKYAGTNKQYKMHVRHFARVLSEYPLKDSTGLPFAPEWAGTTNMSMRRPNFVVIHHTAQNTCEQTLRTFTLPRTAVSAHYVICRDGTVHHMLNDLLRSQHAGIGKWGSLTDMNSASIGIELDNNGSEPFPDAQINSLLLLLGRLKKAFLIPQANFIGHADWAPGRKVDPSRFFSWKLLAENGFGFWYDTTAVQVPDGFQPLHALRMIGYDIKNERTAIQSYKIHFVPADTSRAINETDRKILADLLKKYQ